MAIRWAALAAVLVVSGCATERSPVRSAPDAAAVDAGSDAAPDARAHVLDCSTCVAYCDVGSPVPICVSSETFGCAIGCQPVCGSCDIAHQQIICDPGPLTYGCN